MLFETNVKTNNDNKLKIGDEEIFKKNCLKFLGMIIDEKLTWNEHIKQCKTKISRSLYYIKSIKKLLPKDKLLTPYYAMIYPYLEYGIILWGSTFDSYLNKLSIMQKKAICIVCNAKYNDHTGPLFARKKVLKLSDIYHLQLGKCMYSFTSNKLPNPLLTIYTPNYEIHNHNTRQRNNPHIKSHRTKRASNSITIKGPEYWHNIQQKVKDAQSFNGFNKALKRELLATYV